MVGKAIRINWIRFSVTVAILRRGRTGWEIGGGGEAKVGCGMVIRLYKAQEGKGK